MIERFVVACLLGLAIAPPAAAISVRPVSLDEMTAAAAVVFQGRCVDNRTEREAGTNLIVTYTTFEVHDVLKGQAGSTRVIKQIGGTLPGKFVGFKVEGVPKFAAGENYVVFLARVSSAGFSSPIGLAQGKFTLIPGPAGLLVSNGRDFKELTAAIPALQATQALTLLQQAPGRVRHMGLDDFKQLVRQLAGSAK